MDTARPDTSGQTANNWMTWLIGLIVVIVVGAAIGALYHKHVKAAEAEAAEQVAQSKLIEELKTERKLQIAKLEANVFGKGDSFWTSTANAFIVNLKFAGYDGDVNNKKAVRAFVKDLTLKTLIANGIIDPVTGKEIRIKEADKHSIIVSKGEGGEFSISLFSKNFNWNPDPDVMLSPAKKPLFRGNIKTGESGALQSYEYVYAKPAIAEIPITDVPEADAPVTEDQKIQA